MDFKEKTVEELMERRTQIASEIETEGADLNALEEEVRAINEELESRKNAEAKRAEIRASVAKGFGEVIETVEERKMPEKKEIRSTFEYGKAFIEGIIKNDMTEARALLSTNGTNGSLSLTGYVPVPEGLEAEVKNAWETAKIPSLVKKSYFRGNLKVPFELSATGASIHIEGDDAPDEEVLTLGLVTLIPESIKKWITISDEAIDLNPTILDYIYKELGQKIAEKAEEEIVSKIVNSPTTATATAVNVASLEEAPGTTTIVDALALLSGQATDVYIVMNRATKPLFRAAQFEASYNVDIWEGLEDRIIYSDQLPSYADTEDGDAYMIVGDFGYGFQANFPNGNELRLKTDDLSLGEADLVKIIARQFVALGVVAPKAFVVVSQPSS